MILHSLPRRLETLEWAIIAGKKFTHALGGDGPLGRELRRGPLVTGLEVEFGSLGADRRVLGGGRGGHCRLLSVAGWEVGKIVEKTKRKGERGRDSGKFSFRLRNQISVRNSSVCFFLPTFQSCMDDLDALLDLEGAAFGDDDDDGVFEDDDVGGGGPSTKAGEEDEKRETVKEIGDARRRRPNDKNSILSLSILTSFHSLSC